jgi:hypothetical protein
LGRIGALRFDESNVAINSTDVNFRLFHSLGSLGFISVAGNEPGTFAVLMLERRYNATNIDFERAFVGFELASEERLVVA